MMIKSYRTFLLELGQELLEALRDCENYGWHHSEASTPEWQHYNRLFTWLDELSERASYYDHVKAKRPGWVQRETAILVRTPEEYGLVRPRVHGELGSVGPEQC